MVSVRFYIENSRDAQEFIANVNHLTHQVLEKAIQAAEMTFIKFKARLDRDPKEK